MKIKSVETNKTYEMTIKHFDGKRWDEYYTNLIDDCVHDGSMWLGSDDDDDIDVARQADIDSVIAYFEDQVERANKGEMTESPEDMLDNVDEYGEYAFEVEIN